MPWQLSSLTLPQGKDVGGKSCSCSEGRVPLWILKRFYRNPGARLSCVWVVDSVHKHHPLWIHLFVFLKFSLRHQKQQINFLTCLWYLPSFVKSQVSFFTSLCLSHSFPTPPFFSLSLVLSPPIVALPSSFPLLFSGQASHSGPHHPALLGCVPNRFNLNLPLQDWRLFHVFEQFVVILF